MREGAWLFAFYMAMHPGNAKEKTVHQEAWTAALSSWYLQPSGRWIPFSWLVRAIAKHESTTFSNIEALEGISKRPEKMAKARR